MDYKKHYKKGKQYNVDKKLMIGKVLETDGQYMYPNNNFALLFPFEYENCLKGEESIKSSNFTIGVYSVLDYIAKTTPLYNALRSVFTKEESDLILDYAM